MLKILFMVYIAVVIFIVMWLQISRTPNLRDNQRREDLALIRQSILDYYTYNKTYPRSDEVPFGREWKTPSASFMKEVPVEKKKNHDPYCYNNFGDIYLLCARMEGEGFKCPPPEEGNWVCNTCTPKNGKNLEYNYCLYDSY